MKLHKSNERLLALVKSSLDIVVAVGLLQLAPKKVTPRVTGAFGFASSLIACYQVGMLVQPVVVLGLWGLMAFVALAAASKPTSKAEQVRTPTPSTVYQENNPPRMDGTHGSASTSIGLIWLPHPLVWQTRLIYVIIIIIIDKPSHYG